MINRIVIGAIFFVLTGCASAPKKPLSPVMQQINLLNAIDKGGVRRLKVGDELRLILPHSRFFNKNTSQLKASAYPTLNRLVTLLNQQKNFGIDVIAFTPAPDLHAETSDLARQQAIAIKNYLCYQGLNTRIIVARSWDSREQNNVRGVAFDSDQPQILATEIRTRFLLPEDSE